MAPSMSPLTSDALAVLAAAVRAARLRRRWTVRELAQRVGVSPPTIIKIERGDPTVALGTAFEAAVLVGVPLFDADPDALARHRVRQRAELVLLPAAARPRRDVDDDF